MNGTNMKIMCVPLLCHYALPESSKHAIFLLNIAFMKSSIKYVCMNRINQGL